ncbi:hypothetical protein [Candidatus Glomeribacter gigasporarum]|nr:hypothetical protein [Candidatus Glomeribacter gigasporarum]
MHIEIEHGASAQETRDAFLTARQTGIGGSAARRCAFNRLTDF